MFKRVKISGMSLRGLIAGGLLAGSVGLGFGGGSYGTPSSSTPSTGGTAFPADDDKGEGGSQGPGMAAAEPAALPPNVAPGWKVRVCSEKTKASSIAFKVMSADDKSADKALKNEKKAADKTASGDPTVTDQTAPAAGTLETASWNQGDPSLINFPESVSRLEKIKIEAVPGQKDMRSEVCVLYNDHVAKKLTFDDKEIATVKMNESGACGC